ncbi:glycine--tRNA ligase, partial [Candidatus Woesebacteria bacterium]|nr:glycine--tRNA ligase [Candidatus Woesebacteria bacterium]
KEQFEDWRKKIEHWYMDLLGIDKKVLRWKPHSKLIFYAKAAEDMQYQFPWGFDEVSGLHYRTDYDLTTHEKHSGKELKYQDPETNTKYSPHVVESTWGLNRNFFMILCNAYRKDDTRTYLKLQYNLAPYKVAVFPLVSNKPELVKQAEKVFDTLSSTFHAYWDDRGNIGKRYRYQDEIGTPFCVTIDYQTLEDQTVTVRDRDSMEQSRVPLSSIIAFLKNKLQ